MTRSSDLSRPVRESGHGDDRISRLEIRSIVVPLQREFTASTYRFRERATTVIEARSTEGLRSVTYTGDPKRDPRSVVDMIEDLAGRFVLGRPYHGIRRRWHEMMAAAPSSVAPGALATHMRSMAALDTMRWDLLGRAAGQPCYRLWGGDDAPVEVISIGGYSSADGQAQCAVEEALALQAGGYAGMKLKVGTQTIKEDLARTAAVRRACGPAFRLICDANQAWTFEDAQRFMAGAAELDLAWLEEPCARHHELESAPRLRAGSLVPLGSGQSEVTPYDAARLVRLGAVDVLNFDASCGGGPTGWRFVDAVGHLAGVRMGHHEEAQIASHLLAASEAPAFVEYFASERDPILAEAWTNRPEPHEGYIRPTSGPGFGLELDEAFLSRHTVDMRILK